MVNLASGLVRRGHEVTLVLASATGPFLNEVAGDVEVVDLGARRVSTSLPYLVGFLRRRRPEVLLSTPAHANVVAVWARTLAGIPCRLVLREANALSRTNTGWSVRASAMPKLVRWFYPWADAVVAVSEGVASDLHERAGITNALAIPNPAVTPDLFQQAREETTHPWTGDGCPPVILAVGSLSVQKDYPTLFRAFRILRTERPCRLIVLGEGPERASLERLITDLDLTGDVDLRGFVANPFAYMARASVLALSSRWEGWPNVCAQALAVGTPVVATDCPHGPREILDDGRFGTLVPVGDPPALAAALARILKDPPEPEALRARAQQFTLERAVDAYLDVLGLAR